MKKLTAKEREAVEMLRQLDTRQREGFLKRMKRELAANDITRRVGKVRKLRIVDDIRVEGTFGLPRPKKIPGRQRPPE